jgi:peptidoglycan/LPS O-acetylase OafA/YrhL
MMDATGRVLRRGGALVGRHALGLAVAVAVIGGLLLVYAETLDLFKIVTPGGVTSNAAGSIRTGADQHSWALGVIGIMIVLSALLARWTRQRLPAWAAVLLAAIALAIVLIADLPDVTSSGLTTEIEVGEAEPQAGFWVELAGALIALAGSMALALRLARQGGQRKARP